MRFSAFIEHNLDEIIGDWTRFAGSVSPLADAMTGLALQDHAPQMLLAIAKDMETSQTAGQRAVKSQGRSLQPFAAAETAAFTHGITRQLAGFDLAQVVSEFRALRASVVALWRASAAAGSGETAVEEMVRFNEGIDQALAESIESYAGEVARSRDTFLAVLGHDVRGPLGSIAMATELLDLPTLSDPVRRQTALRIRRATSVIGRLTTDLLEYARSRLGRGIPVERSLCDLRELCTQAVDLVGAAHPEQAFRSDLADDLRTHCDAARMQQVLGNLLNNAVQHGDSTQPVVVTARRDPGEIVLSVANQGEPIPLEAHRRIFEPLFRLPPAQDASLEQRSGVGLGLFIVQQIVEGHGGTVSIESSAHGTVFTVRLPDAAPVS